MQFLIYTTTESSKIPTIRIIIDTCAFKTRARTNRNKMALVQK